MSDKQADYDLLKAFKNRLNGETPGVGEDAVHDPQ